MLDYYYDAFLGQSDHDMNYHSFGVRAKGAWSAMHPSMCLNITTMLVVYMHTRRMYWST